MQELEIDLPIRLTESQYEVLKTVSEASGDTLDEWLNAAVIGGMESDIDLYFGHSEAIKERLHKKLAAK